MKKLLSLILAAAMALSLAACGKTDAPSGSQSGAVSGGKTLSMGTASLGGNFFTMGAAAASVIMDGTGLAVTAQATGGSVYNVGAVNDGELDLAMSQASAVASGYHGTDSYEGRSHREYPDSVQLQCDPDPYSGEKASGGQQYHRSRRRQVRMLDPR